MAALPVLRPPPTLQSLYSADWFGGPWYHVAVACGYLDIGEADEVAWSLEQLGWNLAVAGALRASYLAGHFDGRWDYEPGLVRPPVLAKTKTPPGRGGVRVRDESCFSWDDGAG